MFHVCGTKKKKVDNLEHNQSGWRIFLQRLQRQEPALLQETPKSTSINVAEQRQTVGLHVCLPHKQRPGQTGWDWAGFRGGGVCTPTSWTLRKAAPGWLLFTGSFSLPLLRDVERQRRGGQVKKLQQCTRQVETGWKLKEGESGREVLPEVEGEDVADRQRGKDGAGTQRLFSSFYE